MKKVLVAALTAVMLVGGGCAGGATGGAKAAKSFTVQGHTFTLPNSSWTALTNTNDNSIVAISTSSGSALFEMTLDMNDPSGPPEFKAEGVGEYYPAASCTGPVACYGLLDTADNAFWKIRVTGNPKTAITVEEVKSILASVKKN